MIMDVLGGCSRDLDVTMHDAGASGKQKQESLKKHACFRDP